MPELPEVETIRSDLDKKIRGKIIKNVEVKKPKMVDSKSAAFVNNLLNQEILKVKRRGKLLIIHLSSGKYLLIHLKMTGQLVYEEKGNIIVGGHSQGNDIKSLPNKYSHIIFKFKEGSVLYFNDMRQFGYARIVNNDELSDIVTRYGIEPLTDDFIFDKFKNIFKNRKTSVKAVLLNQQLISGIGNIYADEILFLAGVKPNRKAYSLSLAEKRKMYIATNRIIKFAIKHRGTTFNDYVDTDGKKGGFLKKLKVFGRKGEKCARCKDGIIQKIKVAQRGTHFCNKCQY